MHKKIEIKSILFINNKKMSLAVFNTEENLGEFDKFKLLPDELQNHIGRYVDEIYNEINNYTCNWYDIIETVGYNFGWEYLIDFLNNKFKWNIEYK